MPLLLYWSVDGPATEITAAASRGATKRPPTVPFAILLDEFIDHQMAAVSLREVVASTAGMVVVCTFFMGAINALEKQRVLTGSGQMLR